MLKIVLVGVGDWSSFVHGPALSHYAKEHAGEVELAAVCVRTRVERAQQFCEKFGFQRVYTDLGEMLDREKPDACWAITPIDATRKVAGEVMERGVPVLFEKPPGANLREAEELAEISRRTGTPNMVGFNRRWAPCTRQALAWAKEHGPFEHIYARMLRTQRMDEEFAFGTGIHLPALPPSLPRGTGNGAPPAEGTVDATLVKLAPTPIGSTDATRFQPLTRVRAAGLESHSATSRSPGLRAT